MNITAVSIDIKEENDETLAGNHGNLPMVDFVTELAVLAVDDLNETLQFEMKLITHVVDADIQKDEAKDEYVIAANRTGFVPLIGATNCVDNTKSDMITTRINFKTGSILRVSMERVTVKVNMKMALFPFDNQTFHVRLNSMNCILRQWQGDRSVLDAFTTFESTVNVINRTSSGTIANAIINEKNGIKDLPHITVQIYFSRDPWYYIMTYCTVIYIIVTANICVMTSSDAASLDSRHQITLALLLTLVAFKYAMSLGIARTSYITLMDGYVMVGFCFILAGITENILLSSVSTEFLHFDELNGADAAGIEISNKSRDADVNFHSWYFLIWTIFNYMVLLGGLWKKPSKTTFFLAFFPIFVICIIAIIVTATAA